VAKICAVGIVKEGCIAEDWKLSVVLTRVRVTHGVQRHKAAAACHESG